MFTVISTVLGKVTGGIAKCGKVCYATGALTIDKVIDIILKIVGVA